MQTLKTFFFAKFSTKFITFGIFSAFSTENAENEYFNQHLEYAAPKMMAKVYNTSTLGETYYLL